jgi:lipopolysaccharide export LptBFGC system permease protein LptF
MEYIIGFLSAIVFVYFLVRIQNKYDVLKVRLKFSKATQSRNHYLFERDVYVVQNKKKEVNRQSTKHDKNVNIRVIIMDNQAYWIKDNVFYTAELNHGIVDKETTKEVDTMTMNKVQLDKMIFIIDRLREEAFDDRWGSGY